MPTTTLMLHDRTALAAPHPSAMNANANALFTDPNIAAAYAAYRPTYPPNVFALIKKYAIEHSVPLNDCVDIASGSGQAAVGLAQLFKSVIGLDASPAQVAAGNASQLHNVRFIVGSAEATGLPSSSADAVVVAEALHWFDINAFYVEAARVLRPGGVLAIIGYGASAITNNVAAQEAFHHLWHGVLGPYWHERRSIVDALYVGVEPREPLFAHVERHDGLTMRREWSVDAIVGYARSWSGYTTYLASVGITRGAPDDPAEMLRASLLEATAVTSTQTRESTRDGILVMEWPLTVILGLVAPKTEDA